MNTIGLECLECRSLDAIALGRGKATLESRGILCFDTVWASFGQSTVAPRSSIIRPPIVQPSRLIAQPLQYAHQFTRG
jgi:hypothetical protein